MSIGKLKKWAIPAATIVALVTGGYKVGEWSGDRGYPVVDTVTVRDTLWFKDSVELDEFATFGKVMFGGATWQ